MIKRNHVEDYLSVHPKDGSHFTEKM
jgi:hypothetical protein